ncbi:pyocin activator PrtN family protein [Acinetobacter ursingii]|uniref:pyocin activator PrtN family protein n=1 Tax=Acinetobacter ursingii TaxID=108980 RepID=UPI00244D2408|nr:pyocin activator PrtN family protein [Acinetobacter ursingii]MDH2018879.1 pyocin activator PrtN family protein [Acinetobacter ursingii]MDH2071148.1 pyocin activator PrtN family protein [Acinetobacter ursingii]
MNRNEFFQKILIEQFGSPTPLLDEVAKVYYPRLSRPKLLEKARLGKFPFKCFRLGEGQKSPYIVDIFSFAKFLSEKFSDGNSLNTGI